MTRELKRNFSSFVFFLFFSSLLVLLFHTSFIIHMDRQSLLTLFGTLGSWVGGIVAHLVALILAPIFNKIREKFLPPRPPPPPPAPDLANNEARIAALALSMDRLSDRVETLTRLLDDPDPAMEFGVAIQAFLRRRR